MASIGRGPANFWNASSLIGRSGHLQTLLAVEARRSFPTTPVATEALLDAPTVHLRVLRVLCGA